MSGFRDDVEEAIERAERVLVLIYPSFSKVRSVATTEDEGSKLSGAAVLALVQARTCYVSRSA
ncbi:hypothetical protein [Methylobacterium gnaphalii]|uniref:Uncharacterized protein n=1 Tax=Methylobacterium gnaphalii TaxID=1010610 RepID=A0A512JIJ9_9HYPH|nr:hypothetical protein [Methylobacterium gnaphalii]GEP09780.1 hypothetical protein MGN01_16250 [Methylobacterium gnaphalii]GJD67305.1 hypothetical protein MMMDOFMJ_0219 [Methylobacterium gnaphalii]GLS49810.1 hypothetical protein GCM10007885_26620 [Methylobacterium gnaphalii]